jgi:hypothetical protein
MEAFRIHVNHSDKLNFHNWHHFQKNELSVSVNGRLVHVTGGVCLVSRELAEQYKQAITARRIKAGDKEFDAEVVSVSSSRPQFNEAITKNSDVIRKKLEVWKYPTPENTIINDSGWVIRVQHDDKEQPLYLMNLGKNGSVKLCSDKKSAKRYKRDSFVQKALKEMNKNPKLRAFATDDK